MALPDLKIYPSGFYGGQVGVALTEEPSFIDEARVLMGGELPRVRNTITYSVEIDRIWQDYMTRSKDLHGFDYKERAIELALALIPNMTLTDWFTKQCQSPHYSDYHRLWMLETLGFVYQRRRRTMLPKNWVGLMYAGPTDGTGRAALKEMLSIIYPKGAPTSADRVQTTHHFILEWLKCDGGYTDLVAQLNVLYGRR